MALLAIGAAVLLVLLWALGRFATADVRTIRRVGTWLAGGLAAVGLLLLLVTGAAGNLLWVAGLLGIAWRWWRARRAARGFGPGAPGGAAGVGESNVETRSLAMRLDHASGRMSGRVRAGAFAGRELAELTRPELLALLAALRRDDPESVALLEAWLDRAAPDWRTEDEAAAAGPAGAPSGSGGVMTRAEAYAVLGLAEGADEATIRSAHRRLMRAAHPDQGGSAWLAVRINQARDLLLG